MLSILATVLGILAAALAGASLFVTKKARQLSEELAESNRQVQALEQELTDQKHLNSNQADAISALEARHGELTAELDRYEAGVDLLWQLELARSARTWRQSVAIQPDERSPFIDAPTPLRLALEVETTALREDVGAAIDIEVVGQTSSILSQLLTLRNAQELLAIAAFEQQPVVFTVTCHGETTYLDLVAPSSESTLDMEPPRITSALMEVEASKGLRITIH